MTACRPHSAPMPQEPDTLVFNGLASRYISSAIILGKHPPNNYWAYFQPCPSVYNYISLSYTQSAAPRRIFEPKETDVNEVHEFSYFGKTN